MSLSNNLSSIRTTSDYIEKFFPLLTLWIECRKVHSLSNHEWESLEKEFLNYPGVMFTAEFTTWHPQGITLENTQNVSIRRVNNVVRQIIIIEK